MQICVNGCPKSGTHAALKACELLGTSPKTVHHITHGQPLPEGTDKHVLIIRDPRNVIVSWLRFKQKPLTDGMFMSVFAEDELKIRDYISWIKDSNTFCFKFEDLISDQKTIGLLAKYLEVPFLGSAFPNLYGFTRTWTGKGTESNFSDYRKVWTPELDIFWKDNLGDDLVRAYGYEP